MAFVACSDGLEGEHTGLGVGSRERRSVSASTGFWTMLGKGADYFMTGWGKCPRQAT